MGEGLLYSAILYNGLELWGIFGIRGDGWTLSWNQFPAYTEGRPYSGFKGITKQNDKGNLKNC